MKSKDSNFKKSASYQKKDGRSHARPRFFWYDNDKDLKIYFLVAHITIISFVSMTTDNLQALVFWTGQSGGSGFV